MRIDACTHRGRSPGPSSTTSRTSVVVADDGADAHVLAAASPLPRRIAFESASVSATRHVERALPGGELEARDSCSRRELDDAFDVL